MYHPRRTKQTQKHEVANPCLNIPEQFLSILANIGYIAQHLSLHRHCGAPFFAAHSRSLRRFTEQPMKVATSGSSPKSRRTWWPALWPLGAPFFCHEKWCNHRGKPWKTKENHRLTMFKPLNFEGFQQQKYGNFIIKHEILGYRCMFIGGLVAIKIWWFQTSNHQIYCNMEI